MSANAAHVSASTLGLAALVDAVITVTLLYVAWVVATRPASSEGRRALHAFGIWWAGLAVTVGANVVKEATVALGIDAAPFLNAFQYVYIAALCAAVWGLLYYLVYLFTGNPRWYARLALFYALYAALALTLIYRMGPAGVTPGKWFVQWNYTNPAAGGPLIVILTLLLLLPQIGGAIAYLRVTRKTDAALTRFRVRVISWSLILWLGLSLAAPFLQLGRFEWWQAGGRFVGFAAALAILIATRPPASLRRHLEDRP